MSARTLTFFALAFGILTPLGPGFARVWNGGAAPVPVVGAGPARPAGDQARGGANQFPGGTNPDGSLRPSAPESRLFSQDAYTEYQLLDPGTSAFRIKFLPEQTRVGSTEIVNATRGGSEGGDVEVYDPRTGKPVEFTYDKNANNPEVHEIRAKLPRPVPEGGIGRVLIYKTYVDPRTYQMNGADIVWVRSLSGDRLGVVLPKGFAFMSSNVAAQLMPTRGKPTVTRDSPMGMSWPSLPSSPTAA